MKDLEKYKSKIETAIGEFERKTHTELIIAIAHRSDPYPGAAFRSSLFFGTFFITLFSLFIKMHEPLYVISAYLFLILFFYIITPFLGLDHFFKLKSETERETFEKAKETFLKFHSKGNTDRAILFFLSLWERKLHLLVGADLKAHLTPEELDEVIKEMSPLFKKDQYGHGIFNGIKRLEMVVKDEYKDHQDEQINSRFADHIHFIE